MTDWQNRIIGLEQMPAHQLLANPLNARRHPGKQREALRGSLDTLGWYDAVILNQRTGYLIDGHARVEEQLTRDENAMVPVLVVDMSESEEAQALASHDWITQLAEYDADILDALLRDVQTDDARVQATLSDLADTQNLYTEPDTNFTNDLLGFTRRDVPDAISPTDNDFDIPLLDLTMQATALDLPFSLWGFTARSSRMNGTWGFYVDDYRFSALWDDPSGVINSQCVNAVEPNYSTNNQMPLAVGLWGIYRKRWLARYWQLHGVKIFVDLNVDDKFDEYNMLGVPKGWSAYATRGYTRFIDDLDSQYDRAAAHAGRAPSFVVYGGGKEVEARCKERGWLWIMEVMTAKRSGNNG